MATFLRPLSYRYQWIYDGFSRLAAIAVGGEFRFRQLTLSGIQFQPNLQILDLCCGSGQATQFLVDRLAQSGTGSGKVIGLDASVRSLDRARHNVPAAKFVEGFAEELPFADSSFDLVHTSVALHEMQPDQLREILQQVHRVLKPNGIFTFVDFHQPTNLIFIPGLSLFLFLFETETAWNLIQTDLVKLLIEIGFQEAKQTLYAGGSLQVVQARR
ncbi:class I SAM-dependent methyltransferase [Microcoleus sp. FACHB-1515]|uniref:class I SAM-dependent methyltransferase n=1 Tax=Cyanophyceae TaxID=3028117 RepID=UPI001683A9C1|nr:class I SAM-dependent methyltransferase [Microcoleus sp. FACHB-1515]MBD2089882.1 class I SAM-dependent methyltransferase [Microcoleus sp. FACHB-1515]